MSLNPSEMSGPESAADMTIAPISPLARSPLANMFAAMVPVPASAGMANDISPKAVKPAGGILLRVLTRENGSNVLSAWDTADALPEPVEAVVEGAVLVAVAVGVRSADTAAGSSSPPPKEAWTKPAPPGGGKT